MNRERIYILLFLAGFSVLFLLGSYLKERRKKRMPTYEVRATILSTRGQRFTRKGVYGPTNDTAWFVTFQTADGLVLELSCGDETGILPERTTGILIYRGSKCEKFTPDPQKEG